MRAASTAAILVLALSGCAKGQDTTSAGGPPLTIGGATTAPSATDDVGGSIGGATKGTTTGTSVAVTGTVSYQGYRVTVADGTYDDAQHELRIPLEVENLGPAEATFYGDSITIEGGTGEPLSGSVRSAPTIASGVTAHTAVDFYLADGLEGLDVRSSVLVMGAADHRQVRVPFAEAGPPVTGDPIDQDTPDRVVLGDVTISPSKLELRSDDVVEHVQAPEGKAFLVLTGTLANGSASSVYVSSEQATLALPDGTSGPADSFTSAAPSIDASASSEVRLRWTVPAAVSGACTVTFAADWGPDGSRASAPLRLSVRSS